MKISTKLPVKQIMLCVALLCAFAGVIASLPNTPIAQSDTYRQTRASQAPKTFQASPYHAQVIRVADGDSLNVRVGQDTIRIRLAQIDAPERGQPWGNRSKQELATLVGGKIVLVRPQGQDRYGRTIAHIELSGRDVNAIMVQNGAAWAYRAYLHDPTLITLEGQARAARVGLWAMAATERMPPWEFRAQQRTLSNSNVGR